MQDITRQLERRRQVQERLPPLETIVRGSMFTRHLRCGKPTCRCARGRGARHRATYLSVSFGGGRTVQITLAPAFAGAAALPHDPRRCARPQAVGMDLAAALLEVGTGRAEASWTLFAQTL